MPKVNLSDGPSVYSSDSNKSDLGKSNSIELTTGDKLKRNHLKNNTQRPYRWDLLLRYRLIEIIALWEGRLTTNSLQTAFGIGRQQASKDINNYIKDVAPQNLTYDKTLKGYAPTEMFTPKVSSGDINEYLQLISSRQDLMTQFESLNVQQTNTELLNPLMRKVNPEYVRPILQAARENKRIDISYASLTNPVNDGRVIAPHTLVFNGYRWHIRAYCEKSGEFRDFLLSRLTEKPETTLQSEVTIADDVAWNTQVEIQVVPDQRLNAHQQKVIAQDYGMEEQLLKINTRGALVQYVMQLLRLDVANTSPLASQIMIRNQDELSPWLFNQ
ncbi:WYL domain-containing protein [Aliikangiella sp. G2MR2-5]|uniref:WYL domain-containing protein n=1 Tax=Aliikangiella sp. G2MR2-5 TaxID=2788943 RepID=UPI0018AAF490|nr:WYL domain-containing protein [Aliikangiella sp. G2MR2-5]